MNLKEQKLIEIRNTCFDVLDVGATGNGKRDLFLENNYRTLDINESANPTIVADAHSMPIQDESVDAIICLSTLYCLHSPHLFVKECERILRPKGKILMTATVMNPYCGGMNKGKYCPDYWRFTKDSIYFLFSNFTLQTENNGGFFKALRKYMPDIFNRLFLILDILFPTENTTQSITFYGVKK